MFDTPSLHDLVGVTKTYNLTYESIETMRALFDKNRASNVWRIHAKHLREYIEFFAPKTEQLDMYAEEGKCIFLAFTEKIMHGKGQDKYTSAWFPLAHVLSEVLKQPLQTAISIDIGDFKDFKVVDDLHVVINVKDFKNMVVHAETLKTTVTALYSQPSRPLQFEYNAEGMHCEFTLMTIGEAPSAESQGVSRAATRAPLTRQASESAPAKSTRSKTDMPPPPKPASNNAAEVPRLGRRNAADTCQQQPTQSSQGLFVTDDDDRQWEPMEERENEEEMLGWDARGGNVGNPRNRSALANGSRTHRLVELSETWIVPHGPPLATKPLTTVVSRRLSEHHRCVPFVDHRAGC